MLFQKNVLFEQKKIEFWNEQHSVEYKTDINTECIKNAVNFLVAQINQIN